MILRIARAFHRLVPRIRSDPVLLERTNSGDVLVELRRDSRVALHRQIEASLRDAIQAGRLPRGAPLPPTRRFADDLGVSRGVVVEAYQQLAAEGYLTSRAGSYTRVAAGPEPAARPAPPAPRRRPRIDFCSCRADVSHFPRAAWLRSMRRVLREAPDEQFGSVSAPRRPGAARRRSPSTSTASAARRRAPRTSSICTGYAQGIALVIDVLVRSGAKRLAVEDPSRGRRRRAGRARRRARGRRRARSATTASASTRSTASRPTPWC